MALVNHVCDIRTFSRLPLVKQDFVENAKNLVGINRSQGKVVIGIATVVEMESAQHVLGKQPGNNLLDILAKIMMSGIDQYSRLRSGRSCQQERHAPVGDVSVIESRLEGFVLHQKPLLGREFFVRRLQTFDKPGLALAQV